MKLERNEVKSAIIGMVIGDGCISKRYQNGQAYYQMSHSEKQLDYLLWKQKILDKITSSAIHPTEKNWNGKIFKGYHLGTKRHPIFTKLYNRFYHKGHKVLDEYLVKMITPLSLAIIYMDDGCFGKAQGRNESFFLCTQSFDYSNQLLLKKSLKLKFGIEWNLNKTEVSKDGTQNYRLRLSGRFNDKFIEIIKPYVEQISCMHYKLASYANPQ